MENKVLKLELVSIILLTRKEKYLPTKEDISKEGKGKGMRKNNIINPGVA